MRNDTLLTLRLGLDLSMLRSIAIETRSTMTVDGLGISISINLLAFILAVCDVEYTDVSITCQLCSSGHT